MDETMQYDSDVDYLDEDLQDNNDQSTDSLSLGDPIVGILMTSSSIAVASVTDNNLYVVKVKGHQLELLTVLKEHSDTVSDLCMSPDRRYFISASYDGSAVIWDVTTMNVLSRIEGPTTEIEWIRWNSQNLVLAGCSDGSVWCWNLADIVAIRSMVLTGHTDSVTDGIFFGDFHAVTVSLDGLIIMWDLVRGTPVWKTQVTVEGGLLNVALHPLRQFFVIGTDEGHLAAICVKTGRCNTSTRLHEAPIECVSFSPTGEFIATGSVDGVLQIRESQPHRIFGKARHVISVDTSGISQIVWHNTERLVIVGTVSGAVKIYCPFTGDLYLELPGNEGAVHAMTNCYLDGGQTALLTGGDDSSLRMYALQLQED